MRRYLRVVEIVLSAVGIIALVVAALGISNAMLAAVRERRREIGVLKAIGARDRDVYRVFLVEAATLGFLGGVLGTALGWLIAAMVGRVVNGYLAAQRLVGVQLTPAVAGRGRRHRRLDAAGAGGGHAAGGAGRPAPGPGGRQWHLTRRLGPVRRPPPRWPWRWPWCWLLGVLVGCSSGLVGHGLGGAAGHRSAPPGRLRGHGWHRDAQRRSQTTSPTTGRSCCSPSTWRPGGVYVNLATEDATVKSALDGQLPQALDLHATVATIWLESADVRLGTSIRVLPRRAHDARRGPAGRRGQGLPAAQRPLGSRRRPRRCRRRWRWSPARPGPRSSTSVTSPTAATTPASAASPITVAAAMGADLGG